MKELFDASYENSRIQTLFEQCFPQQPVHGFVAFKAFSGEAYVSLFAWRLENISDEQLEKSWFKYFLPPLVDGLFNYRIQCGFNTMTGVIRFNGRTIDIDWLNDEQAKELRPLWKLI